MGFLNLPTVLGKKSEVSVLCIEDFFFGGGGNVDKV